MSRKTCGWSTLCTRPAPLVTAHPVLGDVPTCEACTERHGLWSRLSAVTRSQIEEHAADTAFLTWEAGPSARRAPRWLRDGSTAPDGGHLPTAAEMLESFGLVEHSPCAADAVRLWRETADREFYSLVSEGL